MKKTKLVVWLTALMCSMYSVLAALTPAQQQAVAPVTAVIETITKYLQYFSVFIAVALIAYWGIIIMTAGGDQAKRDNAKKGIGWTIFGLIIVQLAAIIVKAILI